jgi:hypothetical protein
MKNKISLRMENSKEQIGMIEMVTVFKVAENTTVESLLQQYDDGRPDKVWSIGDKTKNGTIVSFAKQEIGHWYALTDTPSEWQKKQGFENGWSWIFQLEPVSNYSINELLLLIKGKNYQDALGIIDDYFKQKDIVITRFWFPKTPGMCSRITLYVENDIFVLKYNTFLWLKWWSLN